MKLAVFNLVRDHYQGLTTLGSIFNPDGSLFCHTLEDVVRARGIKDKAMTAIPATCDDDTYFLRVMPSGKYGKAVTVFTKLENDVPVLRYGGIEFSYIRWHGGNKHEHSEGCVLINKNRDIKNMSAWGSMLDDSVEEIERLTKEGYDCRLRVTNKPQSE